MDLSSSSSSLSDHDEYHLPPVKMQNCVSKKSGALTTTLLDDSSTSSDDELPALHQRLQAKVTDQQQQQPWKTSSVPTILSLAESSNDEDDHDMSSDASIAANHRHGPQQSRGKLPKSCNSSSSSDSEDSLLARALNNNNKLKKAQQQHEKVPIKRHIGKQGEKQREKEERVAERRKLREHKKAAMQEEKDKKKRLRVQAAQARGTYAKNEIAVLIEPDLCASQTIPIVQALQESGYNHVLEYPSVLGCNAIQWIRRDYLAGGAQSAIRMLHAGNTDGYQHIPIIGIVFDQPAEFIKLLYRQDHDEDDDYPELSAWLHGLEAGWRAAWRYPSQQRPRIILFLNGVLDELEKMWVKNKKRNKSEQQSLPTAEEMFDAITWMLIQFQVECVHCGSPDDIIHNIAKMTRMLAAEPYQRRVSELECVRKIKPKVSDMDAEFERSVDCWERQLQQVPRISMTMAENIVQHFPTARSLWLQYQRDDLSENEKQLLLADAFSDKSRKVKLSEWMYRLFTSTDPEEMLR